MIKAEPMIPCVDYWPVHIPPEKMYAYKRLVDAELIKIKHVIYSKGKKSTTVEYDAAAPHEWILKELKEISDGVAEGRLIDEIC